MSFWNKLFLAATLAAVAAGCTDGSTRDRKADGVRTDSLPPSAASLPASSPPANSTANAGTPPPASDAPAHSPAAGAPSVSHRGSTAPTTTAPRRMLVQGIDITGVGYDVGNPAAPVVLIDFSDFGCPYCAKFTRETYPVLEREYVRTGKVFFKYVPFVVGMFPHSAEATRAVECAAEQGKVWSMVDHVYEAQSEWKRAGDPRPLLLGVGAVAGADTAKLARCYADRHTDARTARASEIANDIGVRVTPSFIVNGRAVEGALPLADFRRVIDAALLLETTRK